MFSIENKPHELIYQFPPEKLEDGVAAMWKRMGDRGQPGQSHRRVQDMAWASNYQGAFPGPYIGRSDGVRERPECL